MLNVRWVRYEIGHAEYQFDRAYLFDVFYLRATVMRNPVSEYALRFRSHLHLDVTWACRSL